MKYFSSKQAEEAKPLISRSVKLYAEPENASIQRKRHSLREAIYPVAGATVVGLQRIALIFGFGMMSAWKS